jgi:hypothetical protein
MSQPLLLLLLLALLLLLLLVLRHLQLRHLQFHCLAKGATCHVEIASLLEVWATRRRVAIILLISIRSWCQNPRRCFQKSRMCQTEIASLLVVWVSRHRISNILLISIAPWCQNQHRRMNQQWFGLWIASPRAVLESRRPTVSLLGDPSSMTSLQAALVTRCRIVSLRAVWGSRRHHGTMTMRAMVLFVGDDARGSGLWMSVEILLVRPLWT